jgi:hypothetical protein
LEYGSIIFDVANQSLLSKLDQIHYHAGLIVSGCPADTSHAKLLECLGWMSLQQCRSEKKFHLMYDFEHNLLPTYVHNAFSQYINPVRDQHLRNPQPYRLPRNMSTKFIKSTIPSAIKQWETFPHDIKTKYSRNSFKFCTQVFLNGTRNKLVTPKLDLDRSIEINQNRTRCDFIFKDHLYSHNYVGVLPAIVDIGCRRANTYSLIALSSQNYAQNLCPTLVSCQTSPLYFLTLEIQMIN